MRAASGFRTDQHAGAAPGRYVPRSTARVRGGLLDAGPPPVRSTRAFDGTEYDGYGMRQVPLDIAALVTAAAGLAAAVATTSAAAETPPMRSTVEEHQ